MYENITPDILNTYLSIHLISLIFSFFMVIIILVWISSLFSKRKSQEYRKLIMDMYVAGRIRQFAEEDKIDLVEEMKRYAKIERKSKLRYQDLDDTIEEHMKEKIDNKTLEFLDKEDKKSK